LQIANGDKINFQQSKPATQEVDARVFTPRPADQQMRPLNIPVPYARKANLPGEVPRNATGGFQIREPLFPDLQSLLVAGVLAWIGGRWVLRQFERPPARPR
jgi:hypothetical protein